MESEQPERLSRLLDEYYAADAADLKASGRLEEAILEELAPLVRRKIASEGFPRAEAEDIFQTAYSRTLHRLRRYRDSKTPIPNILGLAARITACLLAEEFRRNSPEYRMERDVRDRLRRPPLNTLLARWQLAEWLIGLVEWHGTPFQKTPRYAEFCRDDTRFAQEGLEGRHPANHKQVKLPELLLKFLQWVETPLEESNLIACLVRLRGELPRVIVAFPENEENEEWLAAPKPPEARWNWESWWQGLCELPLMSRAAILLVREPAELVFITTLENPCAYVAAALNIDPDEMERLWEKLPLTDTDIANRYETTANNIQQRRSYYLPRLWRRLIEP